MAPMKVMRFLDILQIMESCIKVKKNARIRWKTGNIIRKLSVIFQKKDLQKWKDSIVSYRQRWIVVETVFSTIKRILVNMCIL